MITIGITDCSKWKNYYDWFASDHTKIINLSHRQKNFSEIEQCQGIVLSGGEDVHPRYYGMPELISKKEVLKLDIDEERDEFEMQVIEHALKTKKPLLGICRGLQIANVYRGGTLIPDINPTEQKQHTKTEHEDKLHAIVINPNSLLHTIHHDAHGEVNSAHHQAIDKLGAGLMASAFTHDGLAEALEMDDSNIHPYFLLVQWHPERMKNQHSPLSVGIKQDFIKHVMRAR
jgi:putative glutamine amidotransferase